MAPSARSQERISDATVYRKSTFLALWVSQLVSLLGTDIANFGLRVWTYKETESVSQFGLITFFTEAPALLLSPIAGALADRYPRKTLLLLSDTVSALSTMAIAVLFSAGLLQPWHIYVANILSSLMNALQWPAFKASVSLLIPPDELVRYGGLDQAAPALSMLLSPLMAGLIVGTFGLKGAFFMEFLTFSVAAAVTVGSTIPSPKRTREGRQGQGRVLEEAMAAWRYIWARPGLLGLLALLANGQFSSGLVRVLMTPVLLNLGDASVLGYVLSASGTGALLGAAVLAVWGGPRKRKVYAVLGCVAVQGCLLALCGVAQSAWGILAMAFLYMACIPLNRSCREAIWRHKVPADMLGRVFGLQRTIAEASAPLAALLAGPLADYVFEPWLADKGELAATPVGKLFGSGKGRGSAVLFGIAGVFNVLVAAAAFSFRPLRHIDTALPDVGFIDHEHDEDNSKKAD